MKPPPELMSKPTFTVEETAKFIGIGRSLAYMLVNTGEIPTLKFGQRRVVPATALIKMLGYETTENNNEPHQ